MFENSLNLLKKIEEHGFEAYIVGGFARDRYIGRDSTDVDICTNATPKELKEIFKDSMLPKEQYGSVTVIYKKIRFEITTFRRDIKYENNRLPIEIKYINELKDDLKRRDFTMNTLCIHSNGEYIDLLNARIDIDNKIIKAVGNAELKLKEDSLRILRAVRFATILDFNLDVNLKNSIILNAPLLKKLSYYRKKEELDKIFSSINVEKGIKLLLDLGLDEYLEIPKLKDIIITSSSLGIWAQLDVLDKYSFSKLEQDSIKLTQSLINKKDFDLYELYNYGLYIPLMIAEINGLDKNDLTKKYMELPIKNKREIVLDGNEIAKILNIKPSRQIKIIIEDLEKKIIYGEIENNKNILCEYIVKNYSSIVE